MITKETATKIAWTYQEIESAQKLITDMAELLKNDTDKQCPALFNAFGERKGLKLGVPSGIGHSLFDVNAELSVKIIEKHIEDKLVRLSELMAIATIELKG